MNKHLKTMVFLLSCCFAHALDASEINELLATTPLIKKLETHAFDLNKIKHFASLEEKIVPSKNISQFLWIALKLSTEYVQKKEIGNN